MMHDEKTIFKEAIKTYPVLIQFKEICCGEHIEDDKVCDEMEKKYSPPPGVDTKCDCFVESLKVDAVGDKMADKGFPDVKITFYLPKVGVFNVLPYLSDLIMKGDYYIAIELEKPLIIEIGRHYHFFYHRYLYSLSIRSPSAKSKPVIIEKPHYEIRGETKNAQIYSIPEIIDIETPDKGHFSYVVLVPNYDIIINVKSDGNTDVTIWDPRYYGPDCIEPLVKDLRRKIFS